MPPILLAASPPDVFGRVATCCGSGKLEAVSEYGVPRVGAGASVEATVGERDDQKLLAVDPLKFVGACDGGLT